MEAAEGDMEVEAVVVDDINKFFDWVGRFIYM